jgi:hypothetical protein
MASLKDRTGYSDGSRGSQEFLPLVADVVGWIGLLVCAGGLLLLLGEGLAGHDRLLRDPCFSIREPPGDGSYPYRYRRG